MRAEPTLASRFIKFAEGKGWYSGPTAQHTASELKYADRIATLIGKDVREAQRFVLSDETSNAVQDLNKKIGFVQAIIEHRMHLKTPYTRTWVEMPLTDYMRKFRTEIPLEGTGVDRIGMLIMQTGDTYTLQACWRHLDGTLGFGLYETHLALGDELFPLVLPTQHNLIAQRDQQDMTLEEATEIAQRMIWTPSRYVIRTTNRTPDEFGRMWNEQERALQAKGIHTLKEAVEENPSLFGAWLLMLNAKSGTRKTDFEMEHAQKGVSLGGRKKKMTIRSHKYTVISMSDYENLDGSVSAHHTHVKSDAHYVRGHFKRRSTGMFWWNPFMRNKDAPLIEREAYVCN